jgi:hypothetical protein
MANFSKTFLISIDVGLAASMASGPVSPIILAASCKPTSDVYTFNRISQAAWYHCPGDLRKMQRHGCGLQNGRTRSGRMAWHFLLVPALRHAMISPRQRRTRALLTSLFCQTEIIDK